MITNRETKYPVEKFWIKCSIVDAPLEDGEIALLAGSSVKATDKTGVDVSTSLLDQATINITSTPNREDSDNTCLAIMVRAGDHAKSPYTVLFTVVTDKGQTFAVKELMMVKEE